MPEEMPAEPFAEEFEHIRELRSSIQHMFKAYFDTQPQLTQDQKTFITALVPMTQQQEAFILDMYKAKRAAGGK